MRQFVTALALTALALGACASPTERAQPTFTVGQATSTGQLTVRIAGWQPANGRSVQAVVADVERLDFSVSRQSGQEYRTSFERDVLADGQASTVFTALEQGEWQVTLEAFDARNMRIGIASNAALVYPNRTNTIELALVLEAHAAAPATGEVMVDGGVLPDNGATLVELAELSMVGGAEGVAPLPDGRVLVSGLDGTFVVNASGVVSPYSTVSGPCAAGPDGRIYFADYGTLKMLDSRLPASDPGFLTTLVEVSYGPSAEPFYARRLAAGPDGRIYVGENDRISFIDADLPASDPGFQTVVAGRGTGSAPIFEPDAIAVAPDGTIYFWAYSAEIHRIDPRHAPTDARFMQRVAGLFDDYAYSSQFFDGPGHLARFGSELGPMAFSTDRLLIANQEGVRVLDHALAPDDPRYISKLPGPPGMPALRTSMPIQAMAVDAVGNVYVVSQGTPTKLLVYKPR